MLNKLLEIKVVNSRKVIWDALVGSFKLDLNLVYDEPRHALVHKWLLLTNPKDAAGGVKVSHSHLHLKRSIKQIWCTLVILQSPKLASLFLMFVTFSFPSFLIQGFLKVSIQVLGPNDELITLPEVMSDEAVDIEA